MAGRIEDYAMIGDCRSVALVCRDGSIDWLCLPRFDADAAFAALLGNPEHGRWRLAPDGHAEVSRRYRDGGLVLETCFDAPGGRVTVIDFMPIDAKPNDATPSNATPDGQPPAHETASSLVRIVRGDRGRLSMVCDLAIRLDYGLTRPWIARCKNGAVTSIAGPHLFALHAPVAIDVRDERLQASFDVAAGDTLAFVLRYGPSHAPVPESLDARRALTATEAFWTGWSGRCHHAGRYSAIVRRSLVTLKGLSYAPTGGIVAAPTTSLPERIGGERNWDYRYCWIRDATYTLTALINAGYDEEAEAWRGWVRRAAAGHPAQLQVLYGLAGERRLPELQADWLPGYEGSRPVRIGNAAAEQFQLDLFGEIAAMMTLAAGQSTHFIRDGAVQRRTLMYLETIWRQPDEGIWEVRGGRRHFVHSKAMCWLAFNVGAQVPARQPDVDASEADDAADRARWASLAEEIHGQICREGVDPTTGGLVQAYGSTAVDAALLLVVLAGFLPIDDPRITATVASIERQLLHDGLVLRYDTDVAKDGLSGDEGTFLACSFWLAEVYVLQGRMDEARALFERLVGLCNDVGLLAEEYDPVAGRMLGNFPQAYSHVALINAAFALEAPERAGRGPRPRAQVA